MAIDRVRNGPGNLTEEQRSAIDRIRARHRTPEHRAEEQRARELVRQDFPPATADSELAALLAALKAERERRNVSLTEMRERTGIDRATISKVENGHVPNPTWATLRAYAGALGLRVVANLVPVPSATRRDVEFLDDAAGAPGLVVPEADAEPLRDYLRSRGIVCREQGAVEEASADRTGADSIRRVMIVLASDTVRRRVRALTLRWKVQARDRQREETECPGGSVLTQYPTTTDCRAH